MAISVYPGSESMAPPSAEGSGYWWPSASPDWPAEVPVRVGLIVYSGVPLGARQKAPVTGYFRNYPSEHDGNTDFSFTIDFSEEVATRADALRDHVLSFSGGTVSSVEAVGSEGRTWAVSVTPGSRHPVTVGIEADLDCQSSAAICTADGRGLFNRMALTVEPREKNPATGLPAISGTVEPGQTLTADTSGIADADGLTGTIFTYQWVSYDGKRLYRHPGRHVLHLYPAARRRGQGIQGEGVVCRRRRQQAIAYQRAGPHGAAVRTERIRVERRGDADLEAACGLDRLDLPDTAQPSQSLARPRPWCTSDSPMRQQIRTPIRTWSPVCCMCTG